MAGFDPEKDALRLDWLGKFQAASTSDSWGQVVEAQEGYQILAADIAAKQSMAFMASSDKDMMQRLCLCLSARVQNLNTLQDTISAADIKLLEPVFQVLFTGQELDRFPIDAHKFQSAQLVKPSLGGEIVCDGEEHSEWQRQQAVMQSVTGTVVSLRIDRIGLKDAQDYIDPFMTVLVASPSQALLDTHDTPVATGRHAQHVNFGHQVFLNISLEDMTREKAALFFEFRHFKPKKNKVSTRCWGFMELSELKRDEEMVLELYRKPTDLKKKSIKLHTEKPLYLHLFATFVRA